MSNRGNDFHGKALYKGKIILPLLFLNDAPIPFFKTAKPPCFIIILCHRYAMDNHVPEDFRVDRPDFSVP